MVMVGCSVGSPKDNSISTQATVPLTTPSPVASQVRAAIASTDLSIGKNRLVFGLIDQSSGALRGLDIQISTYRLSDERREGPIETVGAIFRKWPIRPSGIYTAQLFFDRVGSWGLEITILEENQTTRTSSARLEIKERSSTPALGDIVPESVNKTTRDVTNLDQLTSDQNPDKELYEMSIFEALNTNKPLLVVFSTPAFCSSATCGPQLEVVKKIKDKFKGRANFIHVEIYDNPHEIQGDMSKAILSPTLKEWGLPSEPWTFIVDSKGILHAKFEAFTTQQEIENALNVVLQ